ncbi:MAG: AI-2E family transporter [Pseudomonadota bacterium]
MSQALTISAKTYFYFWVGIIGLILGFVWLFKSILMPFILGIVIAYLLNPLLKKFSSKGVKRTTGSLILVILFYLFLSTIIALAAPIIARESADLIEKFPDYIEAFLSMVQPYTAWFQENFGQGYADDAKDFLKQNINKILSVSGGIASGIAAGGQAFFGLLGIIILTPIVSFFMMKEWPAMTSWVEDLIPRQHETMIKDILKQIDQKLSGFIRGQITLSFVLALFYAVALSIAGLNYGFLIGITAGILSIIPLVGSTLGLIVSIAVAWFQSGEISYVAIIGGIFVFGQIVEGNILSPKLLGDSVGLHPLWILFALMAGGALFGIVGMILAVPVAAIIGVFVSFAILQYKKTPLYTKKAPEDSSEDV